VELEGDQLRLKQILINMTKNALKFTRDGIIWIFVGFDAATQTLHVHVRDSGKGIRQEEMSTLFTQFGKLRRTAEENSEGIGMGLLICQNLVRENGGTIEVHSDGEDKGSCFAFTMKMKSVKKDAKKAPAALKAPPKAAPKAPPKAAPKAPAPAGPKVKQPPVETVQAK